jgi:hypothetical protein
MNRGHVKLKEAQEWRGRHLLGCGLAMVLLVWTDKAFGDSDESAFTSDTCQQDGLQLECFSWVAQENSAGRWKGALSVADQACKQQPSQCLLALLLAQLHAREIANTEMDRLTAQSCKAGLTWSCIEMAQRSDPVQARAWWAMACEKRNSWACERAKTPSAVPVNRTPLPGLWSKQLDDAKLAFQMPPGFELLPVRPNRHVGHTFAMRSADGSLEVRYHVLVHADVARQLADLKKSDDAGHQTVTVDSNALGGANFMVNMLNVCAEAPDEPTTFSTLAVALEFHASHGETLSCPVKKDFGGKYRFMTAWSLHQDDAGDVTAMVLFNDRKKSAVQFDQTFHALRFKNPAPL